MLKQARARQAGFSLIEVLVTLVVFSIGLLGAGALQLVSKKTTSDAIQRTGASMVAAETLERMRANTAALDQYLGAVAAGTLAAPGTDCQLADCDSDALADYDLWLLSEALAGAHEVGPTGTAAGGLVDATLCVNGPLDGSAGFYEVAVVWRGRTAFTDRTAHACGSGRYGTGDEYRRLLTFITFIGPVT